MTLQEQQAIWAAEDAAELARGKARDAYYAFITKVAAKEERPGQSRAYLTDEGVDQENSLVDGREYDSREFWVAMLASAEDAAYFRAEEAGITLDI